MNYDLSEEAIPMSPTLSAIMAYDDVSSAKRGKAAWDQVLKTLGDSYSMALRLWKFEVLRIPELKEVAVSEAAKADLIFIAASGSNDIPTEVKAWIELWLRQKRNHPSALVALCDPSTATVDQSRAQCVAYLRDVAHRAGMDFFAAPST